MLELGLSSSCLTPSSSWQWNWGSESHLTCPRSHPSTTPLWLIDWWHHRGIRVAGDTGVGQACRAVPEGCLEFLKGARTTASDCIWILKSASRGEGTETAVPFLPLWYPTFPKHVPGEVEALISEMKRHVSDPSINQDFFTASDRNPA